jgi:hypothetical protein
MREWVSGKGEGRRNVPVHTGAHTYAYERELGTLEGGQFGISLPEFGIDNLIVNTFSIA